MASRPRNGWPCRGQPVLNQRADLFRREVAHFQPRALADVDLRRAQVTTVVAGNCGGSPADLGKAQGEFRDDISTKQLASYIIAAHDGTFLEWQRRGLELNPPEIIHAFRTLSLDALSRPSGS